MVDGTQLQRLDQQFQWQDDPLQSELRRLMSTLEPRFINLENKIVDWEAAVDNITGLGIARVNEVLGPLLEQLQEAAQLGFLLAYATDFENTMVVGEPFGITINSEGFGLFTPTPWLTIQDTDNQNNWGIVQLQSYDKTTGDLSVIPISVHSPSTAGANWAVSASSGVLPATQAAMTSALAAQAAAEAAVTTINADMGDLSALVAAIQSGPVASVAGKTGVITLVEADIANLVADLAAKAALSYVNTQLATKQATSGKLDVLATMTWGVDTLILLSSVGTADPLPISATIKSLLQSSTLSNAQTVLGMSTFGKSFVNLADASAARTALGVAGSIAHTSVFVTNTDYNVVTSDYGQIIEMTVTTASHNVFVPSAASAGDGAIVTIRNYSNGGLYAVYVYLNGVVSAYLLSQNDYVSFRSNGTSWDHYGHSIAPFRQVSSAGFTWTKLPLATAVDVEALGGGGGGGGGARNVLTTVATYGGIGGGGGGKKRKLLAANVVGATEIVTVGAGGNGGVTSSDANSNGPAGQAGGDTSFGNWVTAKGGEGGLGGTQTNPVVYGNRGGQNSASVVGGTPGPSGDLAGGSPGIPSATTGAGASGSSMEGAGAGGSGGGFTSSAASLVGSAGGGPNSTTPGIGGAAGPNSFTNTPVGGSNGASAGYGGGGGGGNSNTSSGHQASNGGDGGGLGAGGGGGGARQGSNVAGQFGGNGGNGSPGLIIITIYF
jgi:hypothetical protein